jgi:hypothetical protein
MGFFLSDLESRGDCCSCSDELHRHWPRGERSGVSQSPTLSQAARNLERRKVFVSTVHQLACFLLARSYDAGSKYPQDEKIFWHMRLEVSDELYATLLRPKSFPTPVESQIMRSLQSSVFHKFLRVQHYIKCFDVT